MYSKSVQKILAHSIYSSISQIINKFHSHLLSFNIVKMKSVRSTASEYGKSCDHMAVRTIH
jgi:hypothetical protein